MKIQVGVDKGTYSFNPSTKKITLSGLNPVQIEQVLLVTNVTDNIIIYDFSNPSLGATLSANVITLAYNTTSMSSTDKLQIFLSYESDEAMLLRRLCKLVEPLSTQDAAQRQRVAVESAVISSGTITTVSTVSTVSAVTSVAAIATQPILQQYEIMDRARIAYTSGIRNKLNFS